ncbi:MAG: TIGR04141 family sporadically distributed protein [Acidobacteria bacterium]|nr:TIGR04141 family sporadically distributed protein [Acidobacteriota bacterium]
MPAKPKSRTLTIFLLKDPVQEPGAILKHSQTLIEHPVLIDGKHAGSIFLQPTDDRKPSWLGLFEGAVAFDFDMVRNASTAAVWLIKIEGRQIALTFGYGRNLLKPGTYQEDFGLRVTLNTVDPNKIKAIDRMTLDAVAQQTRIQAIRDANMSEFGLDVEQDLLRAVTGVPVDKSLGIRFTGRDALQVTIAIKLAEIPPLLARFLGEYAKEDYKVRFPWVEQIHEVDDPIKKAELDGQLIQKLRSKILDGVWLAVPEMVDWDNLAGFKFRSSQKAPLHDDIHALKFLEEVGDANEIDEYTLKKRYHVSAIANDTDAVVKQWPVYRCFYCEVVIGDDTFLLNNARWFRISTSFVQRIDEAVEAIGDSGLVVPSYHDKSEAAYSKRVAGESAGSLALMDSHLVGSASLPNRIEFCDLFSTERQIVHLKRYSSSSTLSHLFAQGVVSARIFLNEVDFRRELNQILPQSHRLQDADAKPIAADFEIVFGIISRSKKKLVLPFFSRVNLKNAYSNLVGMGFRTSLCKISSEAQ